MDIVKVKLSELKPDPNNARRHSQQNIEAIQQNLIENPQYRPFVVQKGTNKICIGNGMYEAMKALNIKEGWVEYRDLDEKQFARLSIADNRTAELAEWDEDILQQIISDYGDDITIPGFGDDVSFNLDDDKEITEDEVPEITEEVVSVLGDVWKLGRHRLMCGDSTSIDAVEKLMDGQKADMVFTDPPYNIGYQGVSDKRTIQNDKMTDEDFVDFLEKALMPCETMYVCCSWQYSHLFRQALENIGQKIKAMIVWDKVNPAQHLDKYFKQHEIIWYCGAFGGEKTLRGDVWQCKRQKNTVHPTMKPLELIGMALQDQPKKKIVYDGFGGSGSTLIACEQLDRTCYMMELDTKYVDVIIKRWQNLTGEQAVHEETKQTFSEVERIKG